MIMPGQLPVVNSQLIAGSGGRAARPMSLAATAIRLPRHRGECLRYEDVTLTRLNS